jgi:hypothetical protein
MTNAYKDEGMRLADDYAQAAAVWFSADTEQDLAFAGDKKATARAALEAHLSKGGVPEGWKLVPVEATVGMLSAGSQTPGMKAIDGASQIHQLRGYPLNPAAFADGPALQQAYRAMLSASPLPSPAPQEGVAPDGVPPHPEASDGACNSTVGNERANGENT